uniref:Superfamily Ggeo03-2 n=1 Tax=Conus magus TaxID=6492 RepID=A0A5P8I0V7_CONMA|nr:superfamily Ggeo03-2 [Conus magus]
MKIYLYLAIVLLVASAIVGLALHKTKTARNWRHTERDESQCERNECRCNNVTKGICVPKDECSASCETNSTCRNGTCLCKYFHLGFCVPKSCCSHEAC